MPAVGEAFSGVPNGEVGVEYRSWLYHQAAVRRLSVPKIATLAGCGTWKVFARLKKFGIPRNPVGYNLSNRGDDNYMSTPGVVNPFLGKTHSPETRARLSIKASVPKPHIRGKRNGMYGAVGKKNPNWKGGVSPERQTEYERERWKEIATLVRERDDYRCRCCGSEKSVGRKQGLHLHHKLGWTEYPERRYDPKNLVLLCKSCHNWVHSNENVYKEWRGDHACGDGSAILANR